MKPLRRKDREITRQEVIAILDAAEYGVLSTVGKDGQPYGIPLSYVYKDEAIYFHCASTGHKLDNMAHSAEVSFCVVGKTKVLPEQFGTEYESAVVFGAVREIYGPERQIALVGLLEKYCSQYLQEGLEYIGLKDMVTKVFKIEISHISGKARK